MVKKYFIYSYIFPNNSVYVGLTNNISRRDYEHKTVVSDNLYCYCLDNGLILPEYNILEENLNKYEAQSKEENWLQYYVSLNYDIINKAKCGLFVSSLGYSKSPKKILKKTFNNEEKYKSCYNIAKKYVKLIDFRRNNKKEYEYSRKYGWLSDFDWLEKTQPIRSSNKEEITDEMFFEVSKQYSSRSDLSLNAKCIYMYGLKNGLLDKVYPKKCGIISKIDISYDEEYCIFEMNKFSSKTEFKKCNNKLYEYCRLNNLLHYFNKNSKQYKYNAVNKNSMDDFDFSQCKKITYNDTEYFINITTHQLYKPLKTKINEYIGFYNKNGIFCFKLNKKHVPYHCLLSSSDNLVTYLDNDFKNLDISNLSFSNINLCEFKELNELKTYYINKFGEIYSYNDKIFVVKEIIDGEYYFRGFNVCKLLCKYWASMDRFSLFDVLYKDGNKLNINLENLEIVPKNANCSRNIKINKINGHYEINVIDSLGNIYFIGNILNDKILKQVKFELKNKILQNQNIHEWIDEYRVNFSKLKDEDKIMTNIKIRTESCGCYWSSTHNKWKSKIFFNDKEYSLGYFDEFAIGKFLYEEAILYIKYGIFEKWYEDIKSHRNRVKYFFGY